MQDSSFEPLREILHQATACYLTVRPSGLVLGEGFPHVPRVVARIHRYGGARTLYRGRKPHCRSLDGVRAVDDPQKRCRECYLRKHCTPQVRVDLEVGGRAYKLMLAYTSARAFLAYVDELREARLEIDAVATVVTVTDRGTWGELRFTRHESS